MKSGEESQNWKNTQFYARVVLISDSSSQLCLCPAGVLLRRLSFHPAQPIVAGSCHALPQVWLCPQCDVISPVSPILVL